MVFAKKRKTNPTKKYQMTSHWRAPSASLMKIRLSKWEAQEPTGKSSGKYILFHVIINCWSSKSLCYHGGCHFVFKRIIIISIFRFKNQNKIKTQKRKILTKDHETAILKWWTNKSCNHSNVNL